MKDTTIRIDKYLSSLGAASRRGIESFLRSNLVLVDGMRVTEHGTRVDPQNSKITINSRPLTIPKKVYFMLNKPKGIITTVSDELGRKNVISFIKTHERIFPIGRLDKDTHGLLLLTNDGELTNKLIHPRYHIDKTYRLHIKGTVLKNQLDTLKNGVKLEDGKTLPAVVKFVEKVNNTTVLDITIRQGKKRQIRRMCEALNLSLTDLQRIQFGPLKLGDLKIGEYRVLTHHEIQLLK